MLQALTPASRAASHYLDPPDEAGGCDEAFEARANALAPGDELVLRAGVYSQSCRRAITVRGRADLPVVIRAADGANVILTRPADNMATENNLEIVDSAHLVIRGLRFRGGSIGVRFMGGHDIVFEDNEVFETGISAVTLNYGDHRNLLVQRNHIHHSGLIDGDGVTGEGIYVGCNDGACRVTDSVFRDNHIHHLRATADGGNDGIEIKPGSGGNRVEGNYIHHTNIGRRFPCIFVYGGGERPNEVINNVLHDCGEGIQVVADAVVRDNLVFASEISGITAEPHEQVGHVRNLVIANNSVWGHPACLMIDLRRAQRVTFDGNGLLCDGGDVVRGPGLATATLTANVATGRRLPRMPGLTRFLPGQSRLPGRAAPLRSAEARAWRVLAARGSPAADLTDDDTIDSADLTLLKEHLFAADRTATQPSREPTDQSSQ